MLQMALNRHSEIVIPPETAYFTLLTRSRRGQLLHWKRIQKDLEIAIEPPCRRIKPGPTGREHFSRVAKAYLQKLERTHISHFGEKSPEHQRRVPSILKTFPNAKFILLVRDGRDVAVSLTKVPWMPGDLYVGFELWLHYFKLQVRLLRQIPERICIVKYENLAANPAEYLGQILEFLGLPYEPQVVDGSGNCEGIPQYEYPYKQQALEPITTTRIGRWRDELAQEQISILERSGGDALWSLGYDLMTDCRARRPLLHVPLLYARIARWLIGREIGQKIDERFGTCFNPSNRTLAFTNDHAHV